MILAGSMRMKIIGRPFQTWLHFAWAEAALEEQGLRANSRLKRRMRRPFLPLGPWPAGATLHVTNVQIGRLCQQTLCPFQMRHSLATTPT